MTKDNQVSVLVNAKQMITMAGGVRRGAALDDPGLQSNWALAMQNGTILAVGPQKDILATYPQAARIDARGGVVIPGLVDPHTHAVFVNTREREYDMRLRGKTYVDIALAGGGIRSSISAVRNASPEELFSLAARRLNAMLQLGTTTVEVKSGYGLDTPSELKMLQVIKRLENELPQTVVSTFMGAHEYPAEYKDNHAAYIDILCREMLPAARTFSEFCDIFTEGHVYGLKETRQILGEAARLGYKLKMHADEIEPLGGAELAAELGAVSADHLACTGPQGITALAKSGTVAVLLPATSFSLGLKNHAPARAMIENGVVLALASDYNPGSCNCYSMQMVIALACNLLRLTPAEALAAATINAAAAISRDHLVGSLEPGKLADLLILDIPDYTFIPFHFGDNNVKTVIKKGQVVYTRPEGQ